MKKLMLAALFAVCAPVAVSAMEDVQETKVPATAKKCCVKCACDKMSNGVKYVQGTRLVKFATATKVRKAVTGALLVATAAVVVKKALAKKEEKSESKN